MLLRSKDRGFDSDNPRAGGSRPHSRRGKVTRLSYTARRRRRRREGGSWKANPYCRHCAAHDVEIEPNRNQTKCYLTITVVVISYLSRTSYIYNSLICLQCKVNILLSIFGPDINTAIHVHSTDLAIISFLFHTLSKQPRSSTLVRKGIYPIRVCQATVGLALMPVERGH